MKSAFGSKRPRVRIPALRPKKCCFLMKTALFLFYLKNIIENELQFRQGSVPLLLLHDTAALSNTRGGSQRIDDLALLEERIKSHNLPLEAYQWYLDLRRYGSVPHSGFGIGIERTVAWICGIEHVRETIPFARTMSRLNP